jgi:hypothetical protein
MRARGGFLACGTTDGPKGNNKIASCEVDPQDQTLYVFCSKRRNLENPRMGRDKFLAAHHNA